MTSMTLNIVSMNKEIEFKFALPQEKRMHLQQWLIQNNAKHKGTFKHQEEYYKPHHAEWPSDKTLRIRIATNLETNQTKYTTCYKLAQEGYREEYETPVEKIQNLQHVYTDFFGASSQTVNKIRDTYVWQDTLEIAFDEVKELKDKPCGGSFIEIEIIKPVDSVEQGIRTIKDFLKHVGIDTITKYNKGYIHMILHAHARKGEQLSLVD